MKIFFAIFSILSVIAIFIVIHIVFVGIKIMIKPTKKHCLKTRLLKKLRKQARKVCYIRASIKNKGLYYSIEVIQDCPHIYSKKFGVLLFGTYEKEEAIEEVDYIRRQWILAKVCEIKDKRLALRLDEINRELSDI